MLSLVVGLLGAGLTGCDPGVHVAWEKDFRRPVDFDCIEKALKVVAPEVRRTTYESDGPWPRGFARGMTVTQFNYSDSSLRGGYSLDLATLPNGSTHLWHEWGKIGTKIPADEQRQIMPLLKRANKSIEQQCGLPLDDAGPKVGDG